MNEPNETRIATETAEPSYALPGASGFSPDDPFVQLLLRELKARNLSIDSLLKELHLQ